MLADQHANADPIARFLFSSNQQRDLFRLAGAGHEVLFRSGNIGGKTAGGAALSICFARGVTKLDGRTWYEARNGVQAPPILLPSLGTPNVGILAVPAYKSEGATEALKKFLGWWPSKTKIISSASGSIGLVYIKPDRCKSDKWQDWSRIVVFPDKGVLPKGLRVNYAWADEPISMSMWREIRMRRIPGQSYPRFLTLTPVEKRYWSPIKLDFPHENEGVQEGRVHIRARASDNQLLTEADLLAIAQAVKNDPYKKARLDGDWVDTAGGCPFDWNGLERWLEYAEAGETGDIVDGKWLETSAGPLVRFNDFDPNDRYLVPLDASAGIRDENNTRDPSGLGVFSLRRRRMVMRYNGYLKPAELGRLARRVCQYYGNAEVVPEINGWGIAVLEGMGDYGNIYQHTSKDRVSGIVTKKLGWYTTTESRGVMISALERAIVDDTMEIPSKDAVESLMQVVLDGRDKVVAGPGYHDEDLIICGIASFLMQNSNRIAPSLVVERELSLDELIRKEFGQSFAESNW